MKISNFIVILLVFLFSTPNLYAANKLVEGQSYFGTLTKVYQYHNALALPPGEWKAVSIEKSPNGYWNVELDHKDGHIIYAGLSENTGIGGFRWNNASHFKNCGDDQILAKGKGKDHFKSAGKTYWCVAKDANWITFISETWGDRYYGVWYNFKASKMSIDSLNAERYGKLFYSEIEKAHKGKSSASMSFFSSLLGSSSSTNLSKKIISDLSYVKDINVCYNSTQNGKWIGSTSQGQEYFKEAKKRRITLDQCNELTGFTKVSNSVSSSDEKADDFSIEAKLKRLKSMLDEGLISQDQYDEKSSKILDDF